MGFKLEKQDCENVLRGDLSTFRTLYNDRIGVLVKELLDAETLVTVFRLQGRIKELIEVDELPKKARNQLER